MKFFKKFKKKDTKDNKIGVDVKRESPLDNPFAMTTPDFVDNNYIGELEIFVNNETYDVRKLTPSPVIIGRDPSKSNIIISEPIISKSHCTIYLEGGEVFIKDNNSTNGVYIDSERISQRKLADHDMIMLGKKGTVKIKYRKLGGEEK